MVTLYEHDAVLVRDALIHFAGYIGATKTPTDIGAWVDATEDELANTSVGYDPDHRGKVTVARLESIAAGIEKQLRAGTP
jgi:hypothetical protein